MRTSNPGTNNSQFAEARGNQFNQGRIRNIDLDFLVTAVQVFTVLPGKDVLDRKQIRIWMKNRVWIIDDNGWTIDLATTGITTATFSGGLLDNLGGVKKDSRYLLWAIGGTGGTSFTGFGATRKPLADFTGSGSGAPGTTTTYSTNGTIFNNCYQFTVGARVIVRSENGTSPNFSWNHGTIVSIGSTTEVTIALDSGLLGSGTVTVKTVSQIEQISGFRPWDGEDSETNFSDTYRLVGECLTNSAKNIVWNRRTIDEWYHLNISYPSEFPEGGTGSTDYDFWRYCPTWTNRVSCTGFLEHNVAIGALEWLPYESIVGSLIIFKTVTQTIAETAFNIVEFGESAMLSNRHRFLGTAISGAGTLEYYPTIVGIQDGGLRE